MSSAGAWEKVLRGEGGPADAAVFWAESANEERRRHRPAGRRGTCNNSCGRCAGFALPCASTLTRAVWGAGEQTGS
eukprot:11064565-Alexandrium_andersonii.AAC.1